MSKKTELRKSIEELDLALVNLESQKAGLVRELAEEHQPKLRHGDYSEDNILLKRAEWIHDGEKTYKYMDADYQHIRTNIPGHLHGPVLGNIFDDLNAMQEDVTEFVIKSSDPAGEESDIEVGVCMNKQTPIYLCTTSVDKDGEDYATIHLTLDEFDEFVLKCRIKQATLKRRQK